MLKPIVNNNLSALFKNIKLLLLDVDGVLTDNQIYISSDKSELKSFCIDDGTGAAIARFAKLHLGLLSGRYSKCTELWAEELGIKCCIQGVIDKKNKLPEICKTFNIELDEIAYVGDALIDIPVFEKVGVSIAVPNSHSLVKEKADIITDSYGGRGVLTELVEKILIAQNRYEDILLKMKNEKF